MTGLETADHRALADQRRAEPGSSPKPDKRWDRLNKRWVVDGNPPAGSGTLHQCPQCRGMSRYEWTQLWAHYRDAHPQVLRELEA